MSLRSRLSSSSFLRCLLIKKYPTINAIIRVPTKDVMDQLKWEPYLNSAQIGVAVKNGIVTLSGQVGTYSLKMAAENAAKKIAGVKAIAEDIEIGVSPVNSKTDTEIAEAVFNA